ncbi:glycoside hydrolase family 128 protein [Piloderma croceum F 1598]|uniref:Glycoside hydrolase family 128 protein n=1 Tax=Piloderma croceum (strain F 1598) TaxID=765440 RepID=A0A0C3AEL5_PILCF|nr:glycoside hydrolase family 128 protein [Piloderma croceum F 1598]
MPMNFGLPFAMTLLRTLALSLATASGCTASTYHIGSRAVSASSKAGLAWPNGPYVDISQFTYTGKVSWYYTWSPYSISADIEFVPMLWGQAQAAEFSSTINQTIASQHVSAVLGMNEPQEPQQSNLTPDQGAQMWMTYLEPLRQQGVRLGSPAPSSAPSGLTWLQDFLASCAGGCTVDFIALHWYDVNATAFQVYLENFHATFQLPLWVTEWTCQNYNNVNAQCSLSDIVEFMNQTQLFMDQSTFVERYAWFGAMENLQGVNPADALMDTSGKINNLGKQYIGADSPQPSTSGNAKVMALSTWAVTFLALTALIGPFALF